MLHPAMMDFGHGIVLASLSLCMMMVRSNLLDGSFGQMRPAHVWV